MAERTYPNDYFAWYNDDQRLAVLSLDTSSTDTAERTTEKYDTFQGTGSLSGSITDLDGSGSTATATSSSHGLATNDRVTISGTTTYDGDYSVTVSDANTFTFSHSGSTSNETGTFTSLFVDNGLRITYKAKYGTVSAVTQDLDSDIGLDTSLHASLVNYVKARLFEDQGSVEQAQYHNSMYDNSMMKQRSRKSGVRTLSVPNL
tara:strand:+ start:200 stop:811 length:612 start_codon:yes stop_codon:yes gene_type:complete